jgi:hypothetical protein
VAERTLHYIVVFLVNEKVSAVRIAYQWPVGLELGRVVGFAVLCLRTASVTVRIFKLRAWSRPN